MKMIDKIIEAVKAKFRSIQILTDVKSGDTGYIDTIRPEDLDGCCAMGEDEYGRKFVTIKVRVGEGYNRRLLDADRCTVLTLFERYTGDSDIVVGATFRIHASNFTDEDLVNLNTLLTEGKYEVPNFGLEPLAVELA